MGWITKCYETYLNNEDKVGIPVENGAVLCPPGFITANVQLEITLDADGKFESAAEVDKTECKTIIPATEDSASRTSGVMPHPLCDQLGYLVRELDEKGKHKAYLEQLKKWVDSGHSHYIVDAVYAYIQGGTIYSDLSATIDLGKKIGGVDPKKAMVRWRVRGDGASECWRNIDMMHAFADYLAAGDTSVGFCHATGKVMPVTTKHPKNIVRSIGNAKLISANDSSNFTYRGRFISANEASEVSVEVSQRAHSALRWLITRQGVTKGNRTFVCWNTGGKPLPSIINIFGEEDKVVVDTEPQYRKRLAMTLGGYSNLLNGSGGADVVIMSMEAATSGRLSVTYFNALTDSDFLDRLDKWYSHFVWEIDINVDTKDKPERKKTIGSPNLLDVVKLAFGTQQGNFVDADAKTISEPYQQLVSAIADGGNFPVGILRALVSKCSMRTAYSPGNYNRLLSTTCAALKKFYHDKYKEDITMQLDETKNDRSYLFGRLLAVLEKVESRALFEAGETSRETNAERLHSSYVQHPMRTWKTLEQQLLPYFKRLRGGTERFYKDEIAQIVSLFDAEDEQELNKPLSATYLLGYYLERKKLNQKKEDQNNDQAE